MFGILGTAVIILLTLGAIAYVSERNNVNHDAQPPVYSLLPGDLKYESPDGRFRFYFPITTSIVVSVVLSLALWLFS